MKVKGYFKDTNVNGTLAKKPIYKSNIYIYTKKWTPNKNLQTALTYIETTPEKLEF